MSSSNSAGKRQLAALDTQPDVAEAPDRQCVFIGDEAERLEPRALQPTRQQHAQRHMRQPAFERIADQVVLAGARKGFDEKLVAGPAQSNAISESQASREPARAAKPIASAPP